LFGLLFIIGYYAAPMHEFFHALPCKALGLEPLVHRFMVNCEGIQYMPYSAQFLYIMGPYIFNNIMFFLLFLASFRFRIMKYVMLIFPFDIVYNYIASVERSDFRTLFINTRLDVLYAFYAFALVTFTILLTIHVIRKTKCFSYYTIDNDIKYYIKKFKA
jgi:hypothetical protein